MTKQPYHFLRLSLLILLGMLSVVQQGLAIPRGENANSKDKLLIVGLDADYAPLEYVDDQGNAHGYDVEFTNVLMKRLGRKFTFAPNKWENISGDVLHGRVDLAMMIYSPYRKDSTNYSRAVFRLYYQVLYRNTDEETFNFRNLKGKHIAYMKSRPISQMLEQEQAVGTFVTDLTSTVIDLSNGKYDAVICFRYQARYIISHYGLQNLIAEDLSLQPREYCYVSPSKQLIDTINEELKKMEKEGIIDDIYGNEIKSQFGAIVIPNWVWVLLGSLVSLLLLILAIIYHRSNVKLTAEHQKLLDAYDQLAEKNNALVTANERAEESSRMKTTFIQQISHEIRTPLNILNGFTQILTNQEMELNDEEQKDISSRINESTQRITGLVNKMLELSEASSQTIIPLVDKVTIEQIVSRAVKESGITEVTHLQFRLQMDESVSKISLQTNLRQAARSLVLLLDNAQKFTKEGQVRLLVSQSDAAPSGEASKPLVMFAVEDTGIGIPKEKAEEIFEAFLQLDDYYDGTGIGLTVARSVARRLGGDICLDTTYEACGSRFIMTLPTDAGDAPHHVPAS